MSKSWMCVGAEVGVAAVLCATSPSAETLLVTHENERGWGSGPHAHKHLRLSDNPVGMERARVLKSRQLLLCWMAPGQGHDCNCGG